MLSCNISHRLGMLRDGMSYNWYAMCWCVHDIVCPMTGAFCDDIHTSGT